MTTAAITKESILKELRSEPCLNVRQLAARHGVNAANDALAKAVADLRRRGKISRIGGHGGRTSFVLATFES